MSSEPFSPFLAEVRAAVDDRLEGVLATALADAAAAGPDPLAALTALAALVRRGGKRLRPALLAAAWVTAGGARPVPAAVIDAGAAFEILQAYFLVHDDWMDGDRERRGGPSVHAALEVETGDAHLGATLAVLAGDYASGLAHALLAELAVPAPVVVEVLRLFARMERDVVLGQILDVSLGASRAGGGLVAAVDRMHTLKTGSYTVQGPLAIGAALAGATPAVRAALARFAAPLGVAFQLRDDLLGTFGDPHDTGKPVGSDLLSGKRTALVAAASTRLDEPGRARLEHLLGAGPSASASELAAVVELLVSCGARHEVESRIDTLHAEAVAALTELDGPGVPLLVGVADALARRSR